MTRGAHLTAVTLVIRKHTGQRHIRAAAATEIVKELALRLGTGDAQSADLALAEQLKRATGCSVGELAVYADEWGG